MDLVVNLSTVTALALLWQLAQALPLSRERRDVCYEHNEQLAFQEAQRACIEQVAEAKSKTLSKTDDPKQPTEDISELLTYYSKPKTANAARVVSLKIKTDFDACFKQKAAENLRLEDKPKEFEKYTKAGLVPLLEKVNDLKCKAAKAEDVLDANYVKYLKKKWAKLSMFQHAFHGVVAKVVSLLDPGYTKCFTKIEGLSLPQLLCVGDEEKEKLYAEFADCFKGSIKPEAIAEIAKADQSAQKSSTAKLAQEKATTPAGKSDKSSQPKARPVSQRVIDFLCDQQNRRKSSIRGAGLILLNWPIAMFIGVVGIPYLAIYLFFKCTDDAWDHSDCPCIFGIFGLVGGALGGIFVLLYCVFGFPWNIFPQLFGPRHEAQFVNPWRYVVEAKEFLLSLKK